MSGPIYKSLDSGSSGVSMQAFVYSISSSDNEVLMAPAGERKGLTIFNDSMYILYIKYASGVTANSFTAKLQPGSTYDMSQSIIYQGEVYGVWDQGDGSAHVTELI